MTHEQKLQVKEALSRYMAGFETETLAAASLEGINQAIITQVKNNNWGLLSNHSWQNIARQVGFYCGEWPAADTSAALLLRILFGDAQHYALSYGIAISNGLGKTFNARKYAREHDNVFYFACTGAHNRRSFITSLLRDVNRMPLTSVPAMASAFVDHIIEQDEPLLIFDDTHLLKDRVIHLLVSLANALTGRAGIILMGDSTLEEKITDGVQRQKTGYYGIYNSFGQRFISLNSLSPNDIDSVCRANGVEDATIIASITNECNGSLENIVPLISHFRNLKLAA